MPNKKVTYFNGRGLGEVIRLILHAGNEHFEDERVEISQWEGLKSSFKYGQLPVLTLECGTQLNESKAIARYLAKKGRLYGKDEWEAYLIDRAIDTMYDLIIKMALTKYEKCEKRKEELTKELQEKHIPNYFGNLVKYLEEAKGEFFAGTHASLADIALITVLDNFPEGKAKFPKLADIYKKTVDTYPGIKKYLETRPETPF